MRDLIITLVTGLLSGGFISGAVALYNARKKVPAEVDSLIVAGAEAAVTALQKAVDQEAKRADRAEAIVGARDQRISELEHRIAVLERKLSEAQDSLQAVREELHDLIAGS